MLIGMISGLVLSYVSVEFLNNIYWDVIVNINTNSEAIMGRGILENVLYIVIYMSIIVAILNRCFSLIHVIPDTVLRWIGNTTSFGEYSKGEEAIKGAFDQAAKTTQETTKVLDKVADMGESTGRSLGDTTRKTINKLANFGLDLDRG
jgi:hypothetical protein